MEDNKSVEYRSVPNIPGYRVGEDGSVWSCIKRKGLGFGKGSTTVLSDEWFRLKFSKDKDGYSRLTLCKNRKHLGFCVHRLVLELFIGPRPDGMEACHGAGGKEDNSVENLRWGTHESNIADKALQGTKLFGDKHPRSILTEDQVVDIKMRLKKGGITRKKMAEEYGVKKSTIQNIADGKVWRHVVLS